MNLAVKRKLDHQAKMRKLMEDRVREERDLKDYQNSNEAKAIDLSIMLDTIEAVNMLRDI